MRYEDFVRYEAALIGKVNDHVASAMLTRYIPVSEEESKARPLTLIVNTFERRKGTISFSGNAVRHDPHKSWTLGCLS